MRLLCIRLHALHVVFVHWRSISVCGVQRLGHAIVVRPTAMFSWLWRAVQPFMDPVTKQKVTFVQQGDLLNALEKHMPRRVAEAALASVCPKILLGIAEYIHEMKCIVQGDLLNALEKHMPRQVAEAALTSVCPAILWNAEYIHKMKCIVQGDLLNVLEKHMPRRVAEAALTWVVLQSCGMQSIYIK
jgi:hypothetical protein